MCYYVLSNLECFKYIFFKEFIELQKNLRFNTSFNSTFDIGYIVIKTKN